MKNGWSWLLLSLLVSASAHAQLYKWVGPNGKVTYSDTPPPAAATRVEEKQVKTDDGASTAGLPFALAEAVRNHPVTLYTTANCAACDSGRSLLKARGIPFTEKTVQNNDDIARLKQAGGTQQLPFITIGAYRHTGADPDAWDTALTAAGYPATSQLPGSYRHPAPQPAAPKPAVQPTPPAAGDHTAPAPDDRPPAAGNAPPGFRF